MIPSPVTGGATKAVKTISTKQLTLLYAPYCDVGHYFTNLDEISVYECLDTGYQFYYPLTLAGDGKFYEELSKEQLYYVPWKSEHAVADTYIKPNDRVFEQGCATGDFLATEIKNKNVTAFGTELNQAAKAKAAERGISFAPASNVDVTCSFQVLEHIADVRGFITEAITATKAGGHIIFGVPNNNGFLKDDQYCFLNMPPHHMGLWTRETFANLPKVFPMDLVTVEQEHLQPNHYRSYYQIYFGDKLRPLGFLGRVINKAIFELLAKWFIAQKAANLPGHTIVAVFKKRHV